MFLGREKELVSLERMYSKQGFQMAVVYGRRRIGKTSLLNEFVKEKNSLYVAAEEVNDALNLEKFSRSIGQKLGMMNFPPFTDWNKLFSFVKEQFGDKKLVFVIDEYPYAATANPSLNSILQHVIDYDFKESNIFLILCGSSMSFMEDNVLGEKSPLFGRRTGQLKVNPLDYFDSSLFYPKASDEDKIKYYSCVGGTPYYLSLIDPDSSFEDNMRELYFDINGYLLNEGTLLMKQEFREPAIYNSILQAIASGAKTLNEIVGFTKLQSVSVSRYLHTLQELNYIVRVIPFGANALKGKTSRYEISENFISFWYRYVFSVRSEIERGSGDVYASAALEDLPNFMGYRFEEITREYLRRVNLRKELPFIAKSFGTWWGKDSRGDLQEVDIIAPSLRGKELLVGECKWRESFNIAQTLEVLDHRAAFFSRYTTHQYLFTKKAVEGDTAKHVTFVSLKDYFK